MSRRAIGDGNPKDAAGAVAHAAATAGEPLREDLRERFETSLGADLSAVRIHRSAASAAAAEVLGAHAYAVGNQVHFGADQYQPDDPFGLHLLAHEVAHTQQQAGGTSGPQCQLEVSAPGDAAEVEADQAADAMVAGAAFVLSARPHALARLTRNDRGIWDAQQGDALVERIKTTATAWQQFRVEPRSYQAMLGLDDSPTGSRLAELCRMGANISAHAAKALGGDVVVALNEMAGFGVGDFRLLAGAIPGVSATSAGHAYTLRKLATITDGIPFAPTTMEARYTNDFGWSWITEIGVAGLTFSAGISVGGGTKPSGVVAPGLELDVTGTGAPTAYWGFRDFACPVSVTSGPGLSMTLSHLKGKVATGGVLQLAGDPGTLAFPLKVSAKSKEGMPGAHDAKISLAIGQGAGLAFSNGESQVTTPEVERRPRPAERQWGPFLIEGFATGAPRTDAPRVAAVVSAIRSQTANLMARLESERDDVKRFMSPPRFRLSILIEGYASRVWSDAPSDAVRLERNQALSEQRANGVLELLRELGDHDYMPCGRGAAVRGAYPSTPSGDVPRAAPKPVTEGDDPDAVQRAQDGVPEAEYRERMYGRSSDDEAVRRVDVTVRWAGVLMNWGYGDAVVNTYDAPVPPPGTPGGGTRSQDTSGQDGNDAGTAGPQNTGGYGPT